MTDDKIRQLLARYAEEGTVDDDVTEKILGKLLQILFQDGKNKVAENRLLL